MFIYNYDEKTKEYLGFETAVADPEETKIKGEFVPLVPSYSTLIPPLEYNPENQIPVFENENWIIKDDYRKNYYKVNEFLSVEEIKTIGNQEGFFVVGKEFGELIKENPDNYKIQNNEIIEKTKEEIEKENKENEKQLKISKIKKELYELDIKRIRAISEPSLKNEEMSWLEFYNSEIKALRDELNLLK